MQAIEVVTKALDMVYISMRPMIKYRPLQVVRHLLLQPLGRMPGKALQHLHNQAKIAARSTHMQLCNLRERHPLLRRDLPIRHCHKGCCPQNCRNRMKPRTLVLYLRVVRPVAQVSAGAQPNLVGLRMPSISQILPSPRCHRHSNHHG